MIRAKEESGRRKANRYGCEGVRDAPCGMEASQTLKERSSHDLQGQSTMMSVPASIQKRPTTTCMTKYKRFSYVRLTPRAMKQQGIRMARIASDADSAHNLRPRNYRHNNV